MQSEYRNTEKFCNTIEHMLYAGEAIAFPVPRFESHSIERCDYDTMEDDDIYDENEDDDDIYDDDYTDEDEDELYDEGYEYEDYNEFREAYDDYTGEFDDEADDYAEDLDELSHYDSFEDDDY